MRKLVFTERAEVKLIQAALFYETRMRKGIRRWVMKKFPYSVIYSFDEEGLRVLAIYHAKRKPLFNH